MGYTMNKLSDKLFVSLRYKYHLGIIKFGVQRNCVLDKCLPSANLSDSSVSFSHTQISVCLSMS